MPMTKYWIVVNDDHAGPYTAEQLAEMKIPGDTYAWHPGLPKWTQIKDIPELAGIIIETEVPESIIDDTDISEIQEQSIEPGSLPPAPPSIPPATPPLPPEPTYSYQPEPTLYTPSNEYEAEKCPPSYLAWSIITTILFFLPLGVVAIIYSAKVNGLWYSGQSERARRASELAAWFSNISFVAGLIWVPFSIVFTILI